MNIATEITNAEIAETIVRTAYSRLHDCLSVLADQSAELAEVKMTDAAQKRLINMLVQDFSSAHNPCYGAVPLRHAQPCDKERDLQVASRFNELAPDMKQALARSAFVAMIGNFNKSPAAQGTQFKL